LDKNDRVEVNVLCPVVKLGQYVEHPQVQSDYY